MFRSDFPIFQTHPDLVFLDSASSSQKPKMVIDAISQFFATDYANIHRWSYDLSMESSHLYEQAKMSIAQHLGLHSYHEVVFTYNATYAFNIISRELVKTGKLKKWDIVLLSKADHHANIVPWQILVEEYGIVIDWVELNSDGTINYDSLLEKISNATVLSITGASNVTGEILDLQKVKEIVTKQENPPIWILDGSQRFPHMETDIVAYGIDIFVATGHKVMSDTGIGFFAAKKELLQELVPAFCWGWAINSVTTLAYEPAGLPFRHEPGTPHIVGAVSLLASLQYIESIGGFQAIEKYEKGLVEYTLKQIKDLPKWIRLLGSSIPENRLWVFAFAFENHHPNDIAEILADANICVRSWHHCADPLHATLGVLGSLRMSLYLYNTQWDIDRFFTEFKKAISSK
jgi:cysteine desulfurase/selenocysteine lyase